MQFSYQIYQKIIADWSQDKLKNQKRRDIENNSYDTCGDIGEWKDLSSEPKAGPVKEQRVTKGLLFTGRTRTE